MLIQINIFWGNAHVRYFFYAKICHAIMSCNTDETTLLFVIYGLWFHEFVLLKLNLNNLTILASILTLEFTVINCCTF